MANKIAKLKKLVRSPLRARYLSSTAEERLALRDVLDRERVSVIRRMEAKGYQLEATVAEVYGLFTRGQGVGALERAGQGERQRVG